ncbi:hypothetical protein B0H67DRAFT_59512 [Lasiosphaeris hirsuta]|uniref:Uncharacterized protein n=1 Tax=Lasiosphaeris hirsuta TaxID=260670 RepID=A0AA40BB89_9PEZI|nr:hypothetical protein B0H67DRAFT_59512 [Lasiosphaeris hirsuta]
MVRRGSSWINVLGFISGRSLGKFICCWLQQDGLVMAKRRISPFVFTCRFCCAQNLLLYITCVRLPDDNPHQLVYVQQSERIDRIPEVRLSVGHQGV